MTKDELHALIYKIIRAAVEEEDARNDYVFRGKGREVYGDRKTSAINELLLWAEPYLSVTAHEWKPISPPQHLREEIHNAIRKTEKDKKGSYC